ncbi:MAG TPA: stage II sporulation protein M [Rhizomicrobium sp.]|jgi:uncharacterized membrane protein SpoIIM required for sporulation
MEQLTLKSHRFRAEREAGWKRLENLLSRLERGAGRKLTDDEVIEIPVLYRAALSSLSVARAVSLDRSLIEYLESLCARAYFIVYGTRMRLTERLSQFFAQDWPNAVRALWRETLVSGGLMALGALVAYVLTMHSIEWFYAFVPQGLAQERGPDASAQSLREILFKTQGTDGLTVFATFLFTHNAQIAIFAFALGFACCLPTAFLMIGNGLMLGAFFALHQRQGLAFDFGGWTLIHGVTELFAVTLAGAAGLRIGWSLAFPGDKSRLDALSTAGRQAAIVMGGVVVMLAFAGLLEGFGRQLITSTPWRYAIAAATAIIWATYFYGRPAARGT